MTFPNMYDSWSGHSGVWWDAIRAGSFFFSVINGNKNNNDGSRLH